MSPDNLVAYLILARLERCFGEVRKLLAP